MKLRFSGARDETASDADTTYKLLDDSDRFPNADAYQLVTCCARLGLDTGDLNTQRATRGQSRSRSSEPAHDSSSTVSTSPYPCWSWS
jgi:hypothetical protein